MRKFISFIIIINIYISAYNQVITGTILEKNTNNKIGFASVYFNGTLVGTLSDSNGNFKLDISKNASMPLSISCIGYYSVTLTDFSTDKPLIIYLVPKVTNLQDVVVSGKSLVKKRKANLQLFKNEFIGTTDNALSCEIMNENDITFNYGADRDTLKAFAFKPILIYNKSLGYKVTVYLDRFEYARKSGYVFYEINIVFNEDLATEGEKKSLYEEKRKDTYRGSRMHFFRALWSNELAPSGFIIANSNNDYFHYNDVVVQAYTTVHSSLGVYQKFMKHIDNLHVYYSTNKTNIVFLKSKVYFEESGYYDSSGIIWQGEMVTKRVGDALPYEYRP